MQLSDIVAEKSILGAILYDNAVYDDCELCFEDFHNGRCAAIYRAIEGLVGTGKQADAASLDFELRRRGDHVEAKDIAELLQIPTAANASYHAERVKDFSRRRQLYMMAERIRASAEDKTRKADEILEDAEKDITAICLDDHRGTKMVGDYLMPAIAILERRTKAFQDNGYWTPDGLSTGFPSIDAKVGGLQGGSLIIIGARTSIGKTAFALNMAAELAEKKVKCGFFSCEMTGEQLAMRLFASEGNIDAAKLRTGQFNVADFSRIMDIGGKIQSAPIMLDDTPNISLAVLKSRARRMRRQGIQILFVDYLTLIRHGDVHLPRHERVGEIAKSLKGLARELDIPIVALSQLGRQSEGQEPSLSDLRQSGELEEDADVIILLNRARETEGEVIEAQVIVAKNRNGETGRVLMMFHPRYVRFREREAV